MSTAAAPAPGDATAPPDPRRWSALAVGLVAAFMTLLDVSIVNVAVPSMERALDASPSDLQWILSGYALTFGLVLVPAGRYGDAHGRRTAFVVGIALFTATSALAGLAPSPQWLIAARLLQGAAAGIVNPQVTGVIQELFRGPERGRPFGLLGATIGISTAVGPLLGGLLIALGGPEHGWRWVFFVNVPVGVVAVVLGWRLLPTRPAGRADHRRMDPVGVVLLGVGVVLVLLPLVQEQWRDPAKWLLVPAGLGTLLAFGLWERWYARRHEPLFDLRLFGLRSYVLGAVIALVYFGGFTAIFFIFTLYLQNGLGYSALLAGLAITPFALGSAAASALGGRIVNRYGRPLVAVGLVGVVVGLVGVVLVLGAVPDGAPVGWWTAGPLLVAGLGSGLVIAPNQTLTLAEVPVPQAGSGAGMLQTGQRIGSAAGIAAVGSVFFSSLAANDGDWSAAFRHSLLLAAGIIALALIAALVDVLHHHR
ncbi:MFS transporter [Micromonospora endolithica]|uniref:MFS transporter n=1 Tax=Micromonospora endolithica TaxID=230091 RepID=A0A3A9YZS5_9ACTN|nr:MFS transporter [Micromonospora endolithica]RKN40686.1 MFS transporter [Micromonospora endolithica]TWJ21780.1 EmrB/QacA subfamily drug resistance transporter [Micromonospora endolithica]